MRLIKVTVTWVGHHKRALQRIEGEGLAAVQSLLGGTKPVVSSVVDIAQKFWNHCKLATNPFPMVYTCFGRCAWDQFQPPDLKTGEKQWETVHYV